MPVGLVCVCKSEIDCVKLKTAFTISQSHSLLKSFEKKKKKEVLEKVIRASCYLQVKLISHTQKPLAERSRSRYDLRIQCQDIDLVAAVHTRELLLVQAQHSYD